MSAIVLNLMTIPTYTHPVSVGVWQGLPSRAVDGMASRLSTKSLLFIDILIIHERSSVLTIARATAKSTNILQILAGKTRFIHSGRTVAKAESG